MDITVQGKMGMSGHARFELIDLETGAVEWTGEQHNLILDSGLEAFGSSSHNAGGSGGNIYGTYGQWRQYFCVGTGSTAPAVGQSALVNQAVIQASSGGFSAENSETYSYDAVNGVYKAVLTLVRVIDFSASYNLTEWGLAKAATGSISIRELFRDSEGGATSIAVTSGKQLKCYHTLTLTVPAALAATSFTLTGLGVQNGTGGFWSNSTNIQYLFQQCFGTTGSWNMVWNFTNVAMPTANQAGAWFTPSTSGKSSGTTDAYVGSSKKITRRMSFTTSEIIGNINEIILGSTGATGGSAAAMSGLIFKFTTPVSKTASNTVTFVYEWTFDRSA